MVYCIVVCYFINHLCGNVYQRLDETGKNAQNVYKEWVEEKLALMSSSRICQGFKVIGFSIASKQSTCITNKRVIRHHNMGGGGEGYQELKYIVV
ncbi:hypothetical protein HanIR_Chr17g0888841 [Helianthus annuus]|nr:hypothetical protein HanIR_Chr17g0888841 [Helianthus annuus]